MELISGRSLAHDQAGGQSRAGDVMLSGVMMVHITLLHLKSDHISISNNNCIVKETAAGSLFKIGSDGPNSGSFTKWHLRTLKRLDEIACHALWKAFLYFIMIKKKHHRKFCVYIDKNTYRKDLL